MEGDLSLDNLGLSEKHLNQLKFISNENNGLYFIHCAADVQFDREINTAMTLNVNGTFQCLNVAKYCNAKSFIHISTLYVNCREYTYVLIYIYLDVYCIIANSLLSVFDYPCVDHSFVPTHTRTTETYTFSIFYCFFFIIILIL